MKIDGGDVVQLVSGGPLMTVDYVNDYEVYCKWFDHSGDLKEGMFGIYMLTKRPIQQPSEE